MIISKLAAILVCIQSTNGFIIKPHQTNIQRKILTLSINKNIQSARIRPLTIVSQSTEETETSITIESVSQELQGYKKTFDGVLSEAERVNDVEKLRVEYLGKKGLVTACMSYMRSLEADEKPKLGLVINEIKSSMEEAISARKGELEVLEMEKQMQEERIDVTLPGIRRKGDIGRRHPISMVMEKAVEIFVELGYDTVTASEDSPEIETDYYCFQALNCPEDHPARDMQDTFYLTEDREIMLRTHTSSVQIRQMEKRKPPFRIVAPGRVYRRDDIDATHTMTFHQVEILAIEEYGNLHLGHLKGTVEYFLKNMFGPDIKVRFRGSYFPFTEPSMEVDVFFRGKWLEVLGCGMVDPNVLEMAGLDPTKYSGFAAGFGVERFAMVMHKIEDIREFYKNDKRFLSQFPHFADEGVYDFLNMDKQLEDRLNHIRFGSTTLDDEEDGQPKALIKDLLNLKADEEVVEEKAEEKKEDDTKPEKKKTPPPAAEDEINISKLDIRVGIIKNAYNHESADKLYCEEIDIGEEEPRNIASGIRPYYEKPEDIIGKRVLVLANLKERKLQGFPSHGMILCASTADDGVVIVEPPEDAQIGDRIVVPGYPGEPATENQVIKKKMLDKLFPDLKTDENGIVTWNGVPLETSNGGQIQGFLKNAPVS